MKSPMGLLLLLLFFTFIGVSQAQTCTNSEIAGIFFGTFLCTLFVVGVATLLFYFLYLRKLLPKKNDAVDNGNGNADQSRLPLPTNMEGNVIGNMNGSSPWGLPQNLEQLMTKSQLGSEHVSQVLLMKSFGRSVGFHVGMKNDQVIIKDVDDSPELPYGTQLSPGTRLLGASISFDDMSLQSVLSILDLAQTNRVQVFVQNNMQYSVDDLVTAPLSHFVKNYMLKTCLVEQNVKVGEPESALLPEKMVFTAAIEKPLQRRRTFPHVFLPSGWSDKLDGTSSRMSELKSDEEMIIPMAARFERSAPPRNLSDVVDELSSSDAVSPGGYKFSEATKVVISLKDLKNLKSMPNGNTLPYFGSDNDTMEVVFRTVTREHSLHTKMNDEVFRSDSALSFMSEETLTGSLQEFIDIDIPEMDKTGADFNRSISFPSYVRPNSPTTLSISTVNTEAYEEGTKYPVNV